MSKTMHVACLGAGVIGASWTALFLAAGHTVAIHDPQAGAEDHVRRYVETAWPTLVDLGLAAEGIPNGMTFHASAAEAVAGADFVQESVPEQLALKHALFAQIEPMLSADAVVASSASGLTLSEMQAGWRDPSRLVLGHPFNPPHLIPLVEVMGNGRTDGSAVEAAERFYQSAGKITIRVNKEVPGHVANRLQAALWREAIHLVKEGVASVADVDKAVWAGPGLRWAAMGPTMLFHLAAGAGGLEEFCRRYAPSLNRWWDDLGVLHLDQSLADILTAGVEQEAGKETIAGLSARRDVLIAAIQRATAGQRKE